MKNELTVHEIRKMGRQMVDAPFSAFLVSDPAPTHQTCSHLTRAIVRQEADATIARCCAALREQDYDTLAFSGNSGALIAPVLAHLLGKELIMVRKPGVDCVSGLKTEGFTESRRYVLVDDLVQSFGTAAHIARSVCQFAPNSALVGMLLYNREHPFCGPDHLIYQTLLEVIGPMRRCESKGTPSLLEREIPF